QVEDSLPAFRDKHGAIPARFCVVELDQICSIPINLSAIMPVLGGMTSTISHASPNSRMTYLPDWQLPPGVSRGLWDYLHDTELAEKAVAAGVSVERVRANIVELDCFRDASFDYAACLFSTLGMVAGADNRRRAVAHVRRVLKPGGVFVLHVHNWRFNAWDGAG